MNLALIRQQIHNLLLALPELADDDVLRNDMVEAETDAHEFLRMLERRRQEAEHMQEAIATNISQLGERKARLSRREEALRGLMLKTLETTNLHKIELPEATLSMVKGRPHVIITDETTLPDQCFRIKREVNKIEIRRLLDAGQELRGACLSNAEPYLTIRIR